MWPSDDYAVRILDLDKESEKGVAQEWRVRKGLGWNIEVKHDI